MHVLVMVWGDLCVAAAENELPIWEGIEEVLGRDFGENGKSRKRCRACTHVSCNQYIEEIFVALAGLESCLPGEQNPGKPRMHQTATHSYQKQASN